MKARLAVVSETPGRAAQEGLRRQLAGSSARVHRCWIHLCLLYNNVYPSFISFKVNNLRY